VIKKISHVAVLVPDLEASMKFWVEALGLPLRHMEHVPDQEVDVAFLPAGDSDIELVEPYTKDSGVARFMQKRGPGIHHICFEVDDIEATLAKLKEREIPLIDEAPRTGTGGKRVAFVHPKGTGGVLVELYELTEGEPARRLERLQEMRLRLETESRVYATGIRAFLGSLLSTAEENGHQGDVSEDERSSEAG
jgi:methylmalonyl-CoA/ethylmalonyl-CoA epimerase